MYVYNSKNVFVIFCVLFVLWYAEEMYVNATQSQLADQELFSLFSTVNSSVSPMQRGVLTNNRTDLAVKVSVQNTSNTINNSANNAMSKVDDIIKMVDNASKLMKGHTTEVTVMEGGDSISMKTDHPDFVNTSTVDHHIDDPLPSINDSFPKTDHDKGKSSIKARKGVVLPKNETLDRENISGSSQDFDSTSFSGNKCDCYNKTVKIESNCTCDFKNENFKSLNSVNISQAANLSVLNSSISSNTKQDNHQNVSVIEKQNVQINKTSIKKHKPTFTVDANDTPGNSSTQQKSDSHKSDISKADYVIPVVAIILSVPLVVVLIIILYKKGSEFWERRHYRRMDFLIDGMYND